MQNETTPLSGVIERLKKLREQDRRNAAEAYAAAANLVEISEKSLETSSILIEEFSPEEQKALPEELLGNQLKEIENLRKSQQKLRRFNDVYRVQRELTLQLLRERNIDPAVIAEIEALNDRKAQNVSQPIAVFQEKVGWEFAKIIGFIKKYVHYSKLDPS